MAALFYHTVCLDYLTDPFLGGACDIWLAHWQHVCIQWLLRCREYMMRCPCWLWTVVEALTARLQGTRFWQCVLFTRGVRQGVVSCTYVQRSKPNSPRRRYFQLPVSGRRMQRLLLFRLHYHDLPIAAGHLAGAGHVDRANRVFLVYNSGAFGK